MTTTVSSVVRLVYCDANRQTMAARSKWSIMQRKKPNLEDFDFDEDIPIWVDEDAPTRTTPYTEQELDALVESTLESIKDTSAWIDLVDRVGKDGARDQLRARLIMRDERANEQSRH